jgi:tRNA (mo5U34)-methyltransferase
MTSLSIDNKLTRSQIEERVQALGPWFHNLDLKGVKTAPEHFLGDYPNNKWRSYAQALPQDMRGQSVLDIGCNAGFFSLEMKRRGAERVVGIDSNPRYLEQAAFAAQVMGETLELEQLSVYEVASLQEQFDWVLFTGVLYHLRYPLLALDLIRKHVVKNNLVFQSMLRGSNQAGPIERDYPFSETDVFERADYPRLHFVERRYSNDPTNWWIPNRACAEALLRSAGFAIVAHPEAEVYVCKLAERSDDWPECELQQRMAP